MLNFKTNLRVMNEKIDRIFKISGYAYGDGNDVVQDRTTSQLQSSKFPSQKKSLKQKAFQSSLNKISGVDVLGDSAQTQTKTGCQLLEIKRLEGLSYQSPLSSGGHIIVPAVKANMDESPIPTLIHQGNFRTSDVPSAPIDNSERFINVFETVFRRPVFQKFSLTLKSISVTKEYVKENYLVPLISNGQSPQGFPAEGLQDLFDNRDVLKGKAGLKKKLNEKIDKILGLEHRANLPNLTRLEEPQLCLVLPGRNKFVPLQLNILKDFFRNTFTKVFAFMKRYYGRAAIRMAKINMTASKGVILGRSTSKQSWIASLIRSNKVGKVFAWVWHPFKAGTVATKTPSSSFSMRTKNLFLRIYSFLLLYVQNTLQRLTQLRNFVKPVNEKTRELEDRIYLSC